MVYEENSNEWLSIRDYLINWHTIDEVIRDFWFQDKKDFLENYNIKSIIEDLISYWNSIWEISNLIWMSIEDITWLFQNWYNRKIEYQWSTCQQDPFDDDDDREDDEDIWDDEEVEDEEMVYERQLKKRRKILNQYMKEKRLRNNINYIIKELQRGKKIKDIACSVWLDPYEFLSDYYTIFEKYAKQNGTTIKRLFEDWDAYYMDEDDIY